MAMLRQCCWQMAYIIQYEIQYNTIQKYKKEQIKNIKYNGNGKTMVMVADRWHHS